MRVMVFSGADFFFGCLLLCSMAAADPGADEREVLFEQIQDWQGLPESVPLEAVIEALSGCQVLDWDGESREELVEVAALVLASVRDIPITANRPNEVGNRLEAVVRSSIEAMGWPVGRPAGLSGRRRSAGYPDLEFVADGRAFYLEIKAFSSGTENSTQRTFYLSPSMDFKVTRDAFHLLLACEIVSVGEKKYDVRSIRWLDLRALQCRLKHEFNASNRDLYSDETGLVIMEKHRD